MNAASPPVNAASASKAAAPVNAASHYVALVFGAHRLVLPQSALRTLEPAADLDPVQPPPGGVGWMASGADRWPVYSLDDDLQPTQATLVQRRICALLSAGDGVLGLLCDDLHRVPQSDAEVFPLPPAMALPGTPLRGIVTYTGASAGLTSVDALTAYLVATEAS